MNPIEIKDIIKHGTYNQHFLLLNRKPVFTYDKTDNWLIAEDAGFFSFYHFDRPSKNFKAFAGRVFDIPLKNGEIINANGQWWDAVPLEYKDKILSLGYGTIDSLSGCYVFCHIYVSKEIVEKWLVENSVSNNYNLYNKKHSDYGKRII